MQEWRCAVNYVARAVRFRETRAACGYIPNAHRAWRVHLRVLRTECRRFVQVGSEEVLDMHKGVRFVVSHGVASVFSCSENNSIYPEQIRLQGLDA